ncbi:hypothetical protein T265_12951, partial [Opisthorchis viverrini]
GGGSAIDRHPFLSTYVDLCHALVTLCLSFRIPEVRKIRATRLIREKLSDDRQLCRSMYLLELRSSDEGSHRNAPYISSSNPSDKIYPSKHLVYLAHASDTYLLFQEEQKAQILLVILTRIIQAFGLCFEPTNCSVMLRNLKFRSPHSLLVSTLGFCGIGGGGSAIDRHPFLSTYVDLCHALVTLCLSFRIPEVRKIRATRLIREKLSDDRQLCRSMYLLELRSSDEGSHRNAPYISMQVPQNPGDEIYPSKHLVYLVHASDTYLLFQEEQKAQILLVILTRIIQAFGLCFEPTNCSVMLRNVRYLIVPLGKWGLTPEAFEHSTCIGSCVSPY